ncbi:hypothetical protein B0H19DRAFT_1273108 [Mycena capillaripes]|nr:hypothetical protein B0H19DRAFT_1273108 [Mycena capillaripes]
MLGFSEANDIHLFYARNGGQPTEVVNAHLLSIYTLLQRMRAAANQPAVTNPARDFRELLDTAYRHVAVKALHRAKKRLASVTALRAITLETGFETDLIYDVFAVAKSASIGVGNFVVSPTYTENVGAINRLQEQAQGLKTPLGFNLQKCIEKMVKVEAAVMALYSLAVSSRRNWMVKNLLHLHGIPVLNKQIVIQLDQVKAEWRCKHNIILEEMRKQASTLDLSTMTRFTLNAPSLLMFHNIRRQA